ncbi:LysR family transcriptional regulator [Paenibacillus whitsoniae]|uniref:LysR family transcriptional regulator n=1 Tax=Paenibacillus whitsoniae TaxID=2496558 RepID=A0A3S0C509_9BACL|nr:LysR family transcriptional regulator [Paenibacillus whitsoniae]RTE02994.1 LysR family transcriptional regulator [Paenibacillus whitsoniae]
MVHNMDLYQAFYFTARTGSLSRAAEELYITQPAVTHAIKQLEAKLGGPLFVRTSKGVTLTTEGETLFTYIEQAYHFILNGERKISEMHQLTHGEVKIGAGDTLCKHILLPKLQAFHAAYPQIKLQIFNRTTADTVTMLKEGKIDIGLIHLPFTDSAVDIVESVSLQDCFVAGDRYLHVTGGELTMEQLAAYPLILLEKGSQTRAYLDAHAAKLGVKIKPEIELGSMDLLAEFAQSGLGIACVVKEFIHADLAQGRLHEIQLSPPLPPRKVGIARLKSTPLSAAAKQFYKLLLDASALVAPYESLS